MSDYQQMREYLDRLTPREFIDQMAGLGVPVTNVSEDGLHIPAGSRSTGHFEPFESWRENRTLGVLNLREAKPTRWKRYCQNVGIVPDDAQALAYQASGARSAEQSAQAAKEANRIARWALAIAVLALLVSILVAIFKK